MDDSTYIKNELLDVIMKLPEDEMMVAMAVLRFSNGSQQIPSTATTEQIAQLTGLNYTRTEAALRRLIVRRVLWR